VFLLADENPQLALEYEERLVIPVVDMDRAGVPAPGEVVGQGESPPVCSPLTRSWDRAPRNQ
jgi:hypothetical protein